MCCILVTVLGQIYNDVICLTLNMQVYIPLLSCNQLKLTNGGYQHMMSLDKDAVEEGMGDIEPPKETHGASMIRDELLNSTFKFLGHIERTLQQLEGMPLCSLATDSM